MQTMNEVNKKISYKFTISHPQLGSMQVVGRVHSKDEEKIAILPSKIRLTTSGGWMKPLVQNPNEAWQYDLSDIEAMTPFVPKQARSNT